MVHSRLTHLGVVLVEKDTGNPLPGIVFSAVAEFLPDTQIHEGQFPLGILSTDHLGYLSFDLTPLQLIGEQNLRKLAAANRLEHLWIYPMFNRELALDVIKVGQLSKSSILVTIEIARPAGRYKPQYQIPSMQNPSILDWHISPGSFAINPKLLIGIHDCENIVPSNIATHESRFRQVVRGERIFPFTKERDTENDIDVPVIATDGFVNEYATKWHPIGHGLGQIIYSLPLAPCESVNIAVIEWSRRDLASREEDLTVKEQLLHSLHRDRSIEETIQASLHEWQRGGSIMGGAAGSYYNISAAIGGGYSTSSGDRDLQANTTQELSDNIFQASNAVRSLNSSIIVQSSQQENEVIQTRNVTNHNHCHALTILYYEILRHFRVVTSWVSKRPVLLISYPVKDFVNFKDNELEESDFSHFDEAGILRHRKALESSILDASVLPCFSILEKLACQRSEPAPDAIPSDDYILDSFEAIIKTGGKKTTNAFPYIQLKTKSGQMIDCYHGPVPPNVLLMSDSCPTCEKDPRFLYDKSVIKDTVNYSWYRQPGSETIYTLIPQQPVLWNNILEVVIKVDYGPITSSTVDLTGWTIDNIIVRSSSGGNMWKLYSGPLPEGKKEVAFNSSLGLPVTPFSNAPKAREGSLSSEERCCINRLLQHLNSNKVHYNRAIWLAEDPDARAVRFYRILGTFEGRKGSILNHIENRILAVYGNYVAFPISGSLETTIEDIQGRKELVYISTENLVSLPVRGVFAEAKLGSCNSCEELDVTSFWDWQKSPCPEKPPEIAPISAITPVPMRPDLTPSSLPSPIVNIVNPPNAPDPTAMTGALSLLGKSEIFRDMSLGEEVSALLQKLASGTITAAQAQQQAKKLTSSSGGNASSGADSSGGGSIKPSPSEQHDQLQVLRNAEQYGDITPEQKQAIAHDYLDSIVPRGATGEPTYTVGVDTNIITTSVASCLASSTISFTLGGNEYTGTVSFVGRYLQPHSDGLTVDECKALSKAGLKIFSIWEMGDKPSRIASDPFGQGQKDAERAFNEASMLGQPTDAPIYFAIDYEAKSHIADIKRYFEGIADCSRTRVGDSKPVYPIGVYGSKYLLNYLYELGSTTGWLAIFYWQTNAGLWDYTPPGRDGIPHKDDGRYEFVPGNIWQAPQIKLCGINVDYDVATNGKSGAWEWKGP